MPVDGSVSCNRVALVGSLHRLLPLPVFKLAIARADVLIRRPLQQRMCLRWQDQGAHPTYLGNTLGLAADVMSGTVFEDCGDDMHWHLTEELATHELSRQELVRPQASASSQV